MRKFVNHLQSALYNILQNKSYSLFCILGTAFTFIFITFLVHFGAAVSGNYPPSVNDGRIISLGMFTDIDGNMVGALSPEEQKLLLEQQTGEYENYSIRSGNDNITNVAMNESYFTTYVIFVSSGFWQLYDFDFVAGRPFTEEDVGGKKRCAVITKNLSKAKFHTVNSVGKKLEMDRNEYEIIGVVDNFSLMSSPTGAAEIWLPYVFNNSRSTSILSIMFPDYTNMQQAGMKTAELVRKIFETKGKQLRIDNYITADKEKNAKTHNLLAGNGLGIGLGIFLFLLIPSLNIICLNMANTRNRAEEIAVRRTFGASRASSFVMILFENLLITLTGAIIGLIFAKPFVIFIQNLF
ncbi:MAG: ABC transporter permease, partial [Dysgonamonadaceae bacterium]|nr:ABC transporter permease [Dysgonamonadaceae bacterium]